MMSQSQSGSDRGLGSQNARDDCGGKELDDFVRAFEEAYLDRGSANPAAFLPPHDHPLHAAVLRELVRVDLEFGWERGCPKDLDAYQRDFPELAGDREGLREVAFEEFRLRRRAGQDPSAEDYLRRYGVALPARSAWSRSYGPTPRGLDDGPGASGTGLLSVAGPAIRHRPPTPIPSLPEVGDDFLGFRLVGELGRGAFARVYLARQPELAGRTVVLKVSADRHDESQTLAQLQHDHIVPIYSRHRDGALRAVCMPYLGSVTLRDVLDDLKSQGGPPYSGRLLLSSLSKSSERKAGTARPGVSQAPGKDATAVPSENLSPGAAASPASDRDRDCTSFAPGPRSSGRGWSSRGRSRFRRRAESRGPDRRVPSAVPEGPSGTAAVDARATLGRLTYVEAVVWMAARLADGLAHAHERGILHRDMKPANILLTDDGRPMLLDFNLAEDLKQRLPGSEGVFGGIGGTLPYMAPEHLEAFRDGRYETPVDARSDLFAFGVIVYEMLAGRPPFPLYEGLRGLPGVISSMIVDRQGPPPPLRGLNPAVSPAVESIVRRCLNPDPAERYQSARDLAEDLERHLAHRTLRHTPEPSRREVAKKWLRRHPWLTSAVLLAVSAGFVGGMAGAVMSQRRATRRLEANAALSRFRDSAGEARDLLTAWIEYPVRRAEGVDQARAALSPLHAMDDPRWPDREPSASLPAADLAALRSEAGLLFTLMARSELRDAEVRARNARPGGRTNGPAEAERLCGLAEASFGPGLVPRAVWLLRARIAVLRRDRDEARRLDGLADATSLRSAADHTLAALALADRGRQEEALPLFEEAVRRAPRDYWANLALGYCLLRLAKPDRATLVFSVCAALEPGRTTAWLCRGAAESKEGKHAPAIDDFGRAIDCRPDPFAYFSRATARTTFGDDAGALADLGKALDLGFCRSRVHITRARVLAKMGDKKGADRERALGLRETPVDVVGWLNRGIAQADLHEYEKALADFDEALRLDPSDEVALKNKAGVQADYLGRTADGIQTLDTLLGYYPFNLPARASRAVLLARLGRRDAAHADAREVLSRQPIPILVYQVAGVFAQTSRQVPGDLGQALRLLEAAFRQRAGLNEADHDPDLDPIRDEPEFQRLLASVRAGLPPTAVIPARTLTEAPASLPDAVPATPPATGHSPR